MDPYAQDSSRFHGGVFHPSLPNGRLSGKLFLSDTSLEFVSESKQIRLPLNDLKIEVGGNHLIFFKHSLYPNWTLYTSDRRILRSRELKKHTETSGQLGQFSRPRWIALGVIGGVFAIIVLVIALIFHFQSSLAAIVAQQIPVEWEQKAGETLVGPFLQGNEIKDAQLLRQVHDLTAPIFRAVKNPRFQPKVHLSKDSQTNAFALPGGQIVLLSGLVMEAQRAEEIMGVLAHETAHVMQQHSLKSLVSAMGITVVLGALLGDISTLSDLILNSGSRLMLLSYSREFEQEADEKAWEYLLDAKVDPSGLIDFFERLGKKPHSDLSEKLNFLSSHPATSERIAFLQAKLKNLNQQIPPFPFDLKQFQNRLRQINAE